MPGLFGPQDSCRIQSEDGEFGYFSAKAMIALMSTKQIFTFSGAPIVEVQRRFPFPARGDTRVMIGFMYPLCKHCGID